MGKRQTTTRMVEKMKRKKYWVEWDYKSPAYEVSELMIDEINDMLEEYNIKINYTWSEDDGDNYKINLKIKDWKKEKKKEVADFFGGEVNDKV